MTTKEKRRRYVVGIDGGGTKTECMLTDDRGKFIAYSVREGSNHQIAGYAATVENVCSAIVDACKQADIEFHQLAYIYLGIAGADLQEEIDELERLFSRAFDPVPFTLVNDAWLPLACEAEDGWGAVSICGTGSNIVIRHPKGKSYTVRALRYELGNYGGGNHLSEIAMHHAFRYDEKTGPYTKLTEKLPAVCDCESMSELALRVYQSDYTYHKNFNIAKLVFDLAYEEDKICKQIIYDMGIELGTMVGSLIVEAGLSDLEVPIILSGSQYSKDDHCLLTPVVRKQIKHHVPKANIIVLQCMPVVGAVFLALEQINIRLESLEREKLKTLSLKG